MNDHIESPGKSDRDIRHDTPHDELLSDRVIGRRRLKVRNYLGLCTPLKRYDRQGDAPRGIPQCSCPVLQGTERYSVSRKCEGHVQERL